MKRVSIKALAALLVFALLAGGGLVQSLAAVSHAQWDAIWAEIDETGSVVAFSPGSDETQRNFAWQSGSGAADPVVRLSRSADMSGAVTFTGTSALNPGTGLLTNYGTAKNLAPNTKYYYQCATTLDESAVYSFATGPMDGSVKAVMFSDIHVKSEADGSIDEKSSGMIWNRALESALAREPDVDLVLAAGDNANVGAPREYLGLFAPPALKSIPFAPCIGNHDKKAFNFKYYMNNPNAYDSLLGSLQGDDYWFRWGDVLFLVFDTTNASAVDHFNFAKAACGANKDAKWRVAMYHYDLHATLSEAAKTLEDRALQLIFDPIMSYFDMDAVFSGHNHRYIRTHVMNYGLVVQSAAGRGEITDPRGMVYFGNTSVVHVSGGTIAGINPENAFVFCEPDVVTYNVLTFGGGRMNVKACRVSDGAVVDEFTILKSEGNMPKTRLLPPLAYYGIVMPLTGIYALIARINDSNMLRSIGS